QPARLEYIDLGPLKLKDLKPGVITVLRQERIINGTIHRKFVIDAATGRFEYKSDSGADVLSGALRSLHLEGYIYFASGDKIGSMIVEKKDQLTFILSPDA